jgi:hypothetical protein
MKESTLQKALNYQHAGYNVIPVRKDKKPFVKWTKHQAKKETHQKYNKIRQWWGEFGLGANVAIVTGKVSNIVVVDVDSQAGHDALNEFLPNSLITPTAKTPKGWHYYFKYNEEIKTGTRIITDTDIRADGAYIIAPPSSNGDGKNYSWLDGLSILEVDPAPMPEMLFDILKSGASPANPSEHIKKDASLYKNKSSRTGRNISESNTAQHCVTKRNIGFDEGARDETLFHLANYLVKGGMPVENIRNYLHFFASNCNPPFPEKEIQAKIQSALDRSKTREKSLTQDIRDWISVTWGNFSVTSYYKAQQIVTSDEKTKCRVIFGRLVKEGLIERIPDKNGWYRKIEADCEPEDWQDASTESIDVWLPFGLDRIAEIQNGNIILIAGEPNAGKTAALMNIARENMHKFKVHYFSSELGKSGFKRRADKFPNLSTDQWKINFYPRAANFADVIKQGEGNLNLIDYLEMYDNFYLVSKHLADIYNKLNGAIAVIGLQKNPGQDDGRGGSFTREKPVLSLALSPGRAKITKLKEWQEGKDNPNGKEYQFKLVDGCRFIRVSDWHYTLNV